MASHDRRDDLVMADTLDAWAVPRLAPSLRQQRQERGTGGAKPGGPRLHGCWETCRLFAYCGLVVEIPTQLRTFELLLPFQRQPRLGAGVGGWGGAPLKQKPSDPSPTLEWGTQDQLSAKTEAGSTQPLKPEGQSEDVSDFHLAWDQTKHLKQPKDEATPRNTEGSPPGTRNSPPAHQCWLILLRSRSASPGALAWRR